MELMEHLLSIQLRCDGKSVDCTHNNLMYGTFFVLDCE